MTLRQFIRQYRQEIDMTIKSLNPNQNIWNDRERELWILNDESLYNWARSENVNI